MRILPIFLIVLLLVLIQGESSAQTHDYQLQNYHPASPTAFEFLKYTELPVSEYTGIPDISVPLYSITVDGLTIPVTLNYHAGGIKVSQEAGWVGLGWGLEFGSIVQEVNDRDDYGDGMIRLQPDWVESPYPKDYGRPITNYNAPSIWNPGYDQTMPVAQPKPEFSFSIYSTYPGATPTTYTPDGIAYYMPINGNRLDPVATALVENQNYDSEPDIFTANFLGHSIKFILNPKSNNLIVLNKQGYKVTRTGNVFDIIVPSGEEYLFEQRTEVDSHSTSVGINGFGGSSGDILPSSFTWMLTKIITVNKKQIVFTYDQSSVVSDFTNYSEKYDNLTVTNSYYTSGNWNQFDGYVASLPVANGILKTYSYSTESRFHLKKIVFPEGEVDFNATQRNDLLGGLKLDQVQILSSSMLIKTYQFNYDYFNSSQVGGTKYSVDGSTFGTTGDLRLKLLSLTDNSGQIYKFHYNENYPLPSKNSLAQDFWGYYNGQLNNQSLIPNPVRLNNTQLGNITGLADNGNNNSANLTFAQAGILTSIDYPTGGNVTFNYELNQFGNYIVPDFTTTTNTVSNGNGLRVSEVDYKLSDGTITKRDVYQFRGGKATLPLQIGRQFAVTDAFFNGSAMLPLSQTLYQVSELNAHGFISTNSLGSGSGVGYDTVIKQDLDIQGNNIGRTETSFNNLPDLIDGTAAYYGSQISAVMPAVKNITKSSSFYSDNPANGTIRSVTYYDATGNKLKSETNTYTTFLSSVYYGTRFFGYASIIYEGCDLSCWAQVPQTLAGYYPIYDIESLLNTTTTTTYDKDQNQLIASIVQSYDGNHQLDYRQTQTSTTYYLQEYYDHAYDYYQNTGYQDLLSANRLTEITGVTKYKRQTPYATGIKLYQSSNTYSTLTGATNGNKIVLSQKSDTYLPDNSGSPEVITFDLYDPITANLLQYTNKGLITSLLWNYNSEHVVAEAVNATSSDIAYTSFEADGKGGWTFTGTTTVESAAPPTGNNSYNLAGGSVSKTGLTSTTAYTVSYWTKNTAAYTITGTVAGYPVKGRSFNGWTYYEHKVTGVTSVTLSGSGYIDELRLYPVNAQMTTYTYTPLVGMSSQCDANNRNTYYQYDGLQRLKTIRDQNWNIIKRYSYVYQTPASQTNNVSISSTNQSGYANYYVSFTGTTGESPTFTVPLTGGTLGSIPAGTYNITFTSSPPITGSIFKVGCSPVLTATGTTATFSNVAVTTSTCNTITISAP